MEEIDELLKAAQSHIQEALVLVEQAWKMSSADGYQPISYHLSSAYYDAKAVKGGIENARGVIALATKP